MKTSSIRTGCASLILAAGLALALGGAASAAEIAFAIDGTANYDSTGDLSLPQLSGFGSDGHYYIDSSGTFSLKFDPPTNPATLLDGPVSIQLSGTGISSPINVTAPFSSIVGGPVPYGSLESIYSSLSSAITGDPVASAIVDYILSNQTGSVVVGSTDYADYVYSYTGTLATGITGTYALATPYDVGLGGTPLDANSGSINFGASVSLSAVPEPTTWALMLVGFGCVGFALRRRVNRAAIPV